MKYEIEIIGNEGKMWIFRSGDQLPCLKDCELKSFGCTGRQRDVGYIYIDLDRPAVKLGLKNPNKALCGVLGEIKKFKKNQGK